ncbi:gas vesicle accessory protein GvpU [Rhizobium leguminosarum]|uniref:gas vesicle accessory protein GvpU n=1 Tax=Rhizobium leguminosarum TaxID=384 RepID=UPI00396573C8
MDEITEENTTMPMQDTPTPVPPDIDWLLQDLVSLANRTGMTIGITLHIGGSIISGLLIGGGQYFRQFAETFAAGFPEGDFASGMRSAYERHAKLYEDTDDDSLPSYIHLADARVFEPSGRSIPSESGTLWRGRISSVAGFHIGSLSVTRR